MAADIIGLQLNTHILFSGFRVGLIIYHLHLFTHIIVSSKVTDDIRNEGTIQKFMLAYIILHCSVSYFNDCSVKAYFGDHPVDG